MRRYDSFLLHRVILRAFGLCSHNKKIVTGQGGHLYYLILPRSRAKLLLLVRSRCNR